MGIPQMGDHRQVGLNHGMQRRHIAGTRNSNFQQGKLRTQRNIQQTQRYPQLRIVTPRTLCHRKIPFK